jgi:hypothetical protein
MRNDDFRKLKKRWTGRVSSVLGLPSLPSRMAGLAAHGNAKLAGLYTPRVRVQQRRRRKAVIEQLMQNVIRTMTRAELLDLFKEFPDATCKELAARANRSQAWVREVLWRNGNLKPVPPPRKKYEMTEVQIESRIERFKIQAVEDGLDGDDGCADWDADYACAALKTSLQAGIRPTEFDMHLLRHFPPDIIKSHLNRSHLPVPDETKP